MRMRMKNFLYSYFKYTLSYDFKYFLVYFSSCKKNVKLCLEIASQCSFFHLDFFLKMSFAFG